jgi:ZIP family zinc transporter
LTEEALLAGFWGFVSGSALLVGALLGLYTDASQRTVSIVMAVGAGVLISSVAFDLMEEAYKAGGFDAASGGLLLGTVAFSPQIGQLTRLGAATASARKGSRRVAPPWRSPSGR